MHRETSEARAASCSRRCKTIMIAIHPTCYHLAINNCFAFILNSPLLQLRSNIVRELDLKENNQIQRKQTREASHRASGILQRFARTRSRRTVEKSRTRSRGFTRLRFREENRDFKQNPRHQTDDSFLPKISETDHPDC